MSSPDYLHRSSAEHTLDWVYRTSRPNGAVASGHGLGSDDVGLPAAHETKPARSYNTKRLLGRDLTVLMCLLVLLMFLVLASREFISFEELEEAAN